MLEWGFSRASSLRFSMKDPSHSGLRRGGVCRRVPGVALLTSKDETDTTAKELRAVPSLLRNFKRGAFSRGTQN